MNVDIRLATENDIEAMRLLRNENRSAYFSTDEVTPEQQAKWWEGRDRSTLYFVGETTCPICDSVGVTGYTAPGSGVTLTGAWECETCRGNRKANVWQFSLSADGCLGNLAVASWAKGQGVARDCVRRVLVPGQRYWGLFRTDNPTILRFWPSVGFPEPTYTAPGDKDRGNYPPGSVKWVDHIWPGHPGVEPWFVEQARGLSTKEDWHKGIVEKLEDCPFRKATAWLLGCWLSDRPQEHGIPKPVSDALALLSKGISESHLDWILRIKRLSHDGIAKDVKLASCELNPTELNRFAWHILERT